MGYLMPPCKCELERADDIQRTSKEEPISPFWAFFFGALFVLTIMGMVNLCSG